MSDAEEQMKAANAAAKEEAHLSEIEHRSEMSRLRAKQEKPKEPQVYEFIVRRKFNALQIRKPLTNQVLPKHRQF